MDPVITAGLLGFGGSIMSGLFGQSSADASMAFQREAMQNRYQWTVQDLKKAGLNPMMAIGGLASGGVSGATAHMDNPAAAAVQSAAAAKQMDIVERQQRNQDASTAAQVAATNALKAKTEAETLTTLDQHKSGYWMANSDMLGASAAEKREQIGNLASQRLLIAQQVQESKTRISQLSAQIANIQKEGDLINANVRKVGAETHESNTRASLNQASAKLSEANKEIAFEQAKLTKAQTLASEYDAEARKLGLSKSKEDAYWYENPFLRGILRGGKVIHTVSPFIK